jgi:light-regulated signal transduction histidine kinase (bacteriophytochrome)
MTERVRAEEHIRQLNAELEKRVQERTAELQRSNEALQQFAYSASHDLQEPLRMISSYTQLLARRYRERFDGEAQEFIDYVVEGTNRMSQLIKDLLAFSRAGSASAAAPESIEMMPLIARAIRNLEAAFEESGAVLTTDEFPVVTGRPTGLAQVLQNLIGNAIKYRGPQQPRIHVSSDQSDDEWIFCVADNGLGFEPAQAERIFGIFKRLHGRQYPGTGIGLAICKRIIESGGGRIWAESEPGTGSKFYFTLPKTDGATAQPPQSP